MLGDDDLMDFMNLTSLRTGVSGIVFISTAMGPHGARVKYFTAFVVPVLNFGSVGTLAKLVNPECSG